MSNLQVIYNQEVLGQDFKIYGTKEEPLFLAKDVANWIEHKNITHMMNTVDEDEKLTYTICNSGQGREMWFLTEDGLYEVLMQSRKPIAKQFKKKVKEILKQIRKTGGYIPVAEDEDDATIMARALLVAQKTIDNKNKELEAKTKELEDKNRFINQIAESRNSLLVREVAKIISKSDSNILIGEKRLYEKLREWGWVHYKGTEPKQYALDRGYLEVKEGTVTNQSGTFTYYTTKVTGKGQKRILEKLLKEQSEKNKQLKIDI
ncbi:phage antirepressor KilAC domain-containing protein [Intestinibacter bartlettii]|jgi:prophage antirepressor-like protein|uniref:phage antirepressor KilAC domain-containing protein n=1 Tax=Intestinibacter bartlettii TaxID=261299 RepID=UPI00205750F8|nr:MAG TPA: repressor domain protein [Caudoviricetes sp.]